MLINLLSNAVKFTDNGKIELDATYVKDIENRKILVKIRVKDTGIGISTEKSDVIFEKFTRLRPSYTSQQAGSGLGLRMVKQLTDELDADIYVNSQLGEGTEFVIIMPFKLPWENA